MKAWAVTSYKNPIQQIEIAEPAVGVDDILIEVKAIGLNHLDELMRRGEFKALMPVAMPFVLGHDVSGVVAAVGANVSNFKVGDHVYSRPTTSGGGALTGRVAIKQSEVSLVPAGFTFEQAAAVPLVGLTAWQSLIELAKLAPGQRVLIHGGAGGVGIIAVQLAKHLGAHVTATASAADREFVADLGADTVLDYRKQYFSGQGRVFDLVLDSVGGETLLKSLEVLKPGGLAIGLTGPADAEFAKRLNANPVVSLLVKLLAAKVTRKAAKLGVRYRFMFMQPSGAQLNQLTRLIEAGIIRSFVGGTYSFEHAPEALADLVQGKVRRGKAVVVLD